MGGKLERKRKRRDLKSEQGYLLVSTMIFLIFSGLFAQSMITISGNHLIQLKQITASYQARTSLNMAKEILLQEIDEGSFPETGLVQTSIGDIEITPGEDEGEIYYLLILQTDSGTTYSDQISIVVPESDSTLHESDLKETPNNVKQP